MDVCRMRRPPISHLLSVRGTSSQLNIFEAEIHERSDLMGSPGLFTHTTDIHIALSPQMLCHIMAVLTSWCKASIGVFALYISF